MIYILGLASGFALGTWFVIGLEMWDDHRNAPTPPPAAVQHATGTPTTPSTDNEPQRAQEETAP